MRYRCKRQCGRGRVCRLRGERGGRKGGGCGSGLGRQRGVHILTQGKAQGKERKNKRIESGWKPPNSTGTEKFTCSRCRTRVSASPLEPRAAAEPATTSQSMSCSNCKWSAFGASSATGSAGASECELGRRDKASKQKSERHQASQKAKNQEERRGEHATILPRLVAAAAPERPWRVRRARA